MAAEEELLVVVVEEEEEATRACVVGHARSVGAPAHILDFVRRLLLIKVSINVTLNFNHPNFNSMYYQLISCVI